MASREELQLQQEQLAARQESVEGEEFDPSFWEDTEALIDRGGADTRQVKEAVTTLRNFAQGLEFQASPDLQSKIDAIEDEIDLAWDEFENEVGSESAKKPVEDSTTVANPELVAKLTDEETRYDAISEIEGGIGEILSAESVDFDSLGILLETAKSDKEVRDIVFSNLEFSFSKKYADLLFESKEFRGSLEKLSKELEGTLGEDGPPLMKDRSLARVIAVHETIGESVLPLVKAMDLSKYEASLKALSSKEGVLQPGLLNYAEETGELETDVVVSLDFLNEEAKQAQIVRIFSRSQLKTPAGEARVIKKVKHDLFSLSPEFHSSGIAAKVTKECLTEYDKLSIDEITLHANLDVGGYAWASYGYGWDKKEMEESGESVEALIERSIHHAEETFNQAGLQEDTTAVALLEALKKYQEYPESVTPQMIASLGRKGPLLHKSKFGNWYTKEGLQKAIESGDEEGEANPKLGGMHLGKILLLGISWYGKLELKKDGSQGGKNRELLEAKLERSLSN